MAGIVDGIWFVGWNLGLYLIAVGMGNAVFLAYRRSWRLEEKK